MDEKRKKLIDLLQEMNFPLLGKELEVKLAAMSNEEVDELFDTYSVIDQEENDLEDFVREKFPAEYKKLLAERDSQLQKSEGDYLWDMEKAQEEEDIGLDSINVKKEREIGEIVDGQTENMNLVEDIQKEIEDNLPKNAHTPLLTKPSDNGDKL